MLAEDEADAIQVQAERPVTENAPRPDDGEAVELTVREDAAGTQITSGREPASDKSFMSYVHLTAAELEGAMDAAAQKIQQFWRQMDARFRRALDGESTVSAVIDTSAVATSSADAVQASSPAAERAAVEAEEEKPVAAGDTAVAAGDTAVSGSEATSPSYTPYSTPREAESDDPQSPLQEEQEEEQHGQDE